MVVDGIQVSLGMCDFAFFGRTFDEWMIKITVTSNCAFFFLFLGLWDTGESTKKKLNTTLISFGSFDVL